jgi:hypothetical protein
MSVLVCTSINAAAPLAIVEVCNSFSPLLGTLAIRYNVCFYGTEGVLDNYWAVVGFLCWLSWVVGVDAWTRGVRIR